MEVSILTVRVAVIGAGYWGKNYLRIINELEESELSYIVDADLQKQSLAKIYKTKFASSIEDVLNDENVDAVIIATPSASHYELTKQFLLAGKHVLTEKPMALTVKDANSLYLLAKKEQKVLMSGHVFSFNPVVRYLKEHIIKENRLGELYFMINTRMGFFPPRKDSGIIIDLAIHDIDIVTNILDRKLPDSVYAQGASYIRNLHEELSFITLEYLRPATSPFLAHIVTSWMTPMKVRDAWVIGSEASAKIDFMSQELEIFEASFEFAQFQAKNIESEGDSFPHDIRAKLGPSYKPYIQKMEPLRLQTLNFLRSCEGKEEPIVDGKIASDVIRICELARESIKSGKKIYVDKKKLEENPLLH